MNKGVATKWPKLDTAVEYFVYLWIQRTWVLSLEGDKMGYRTGYKDLVYIISMINQIHRVEISHKSGLYL